MSAAISSLLRRYDLNHSSLSHHSYRDAGIEISPLSVNDSEAYCEIYSDPTVMKLAGGTIESSRIRKHFHELLAEDKSVLPKYRVYKVIRLDNAQLVGFVGLYWEFPGSDCGELGIILKSRTTLKGTACIAIKLFINHLFETTGIKQVKSVFSTKNRAAYLSAKSVGFQIGKSTYDKRKSDTVYCGVISKGQWQQE